MAHRNVDNVEANRPGAVPAPHATGPTGPTERVAAIHTGARGTTRTARAEALEPTDPVARARAAAPIRVADLAETADRTAGRAAAVTPTAARGAVPDRMVNRGAVRVRTAAREAGLIRTVRVAAPAPTAVRAAMPVPRVADRSRGAAADSVVRVEARIRMARVGVRTPTVRAVVPIRVGRVAARPARAVEMRETLRGARASGRIAPGSGVIAMPIAAGSAVGARSRRARPRARSSSRSRIATLPRRCC